ncbi:hypothetical protein [Luteibacter sp. dw_328]|uniref:hypothetical protein n=1 Tax=Luteibacter sp. dw_328 TaxID=2719796 RepID=UPI001BD5DD97|nr:hypothetical protein [Luteibacter sp. dw_328]
MALPRHALATLELYSTEKCGRKGPLLRGQQWRGDLRFMNGEGSYYGFLVDMDDELFPGEVRRVYLAFTRPDLVAPLAKPGAKVLYCEGHPVGEGQILEFYLSGKGLKGWAP